MKIVIRLTEAGVWTIKNTIQKKKLFFCDMDLLKWKVWIIFSIVSVLFFITIN